MQTTSKSTNNFNGLHYPRFDETHLKFFETMIERTRQDRLSLEPELLSKKFFDLQWNCFLVIEMQYQWMIDFTVAVKEAAAEEILTGAYVDAQDIYEVTQSSNLTREDIAHLL